MKKHILRLLALLFSFSLIAAACGGNSDNGDSGDSNDSGTEAAESEAEEEREDEGGGLSQDAIEKAVSGDDAEEEVDDDAPIFDRSTLDGIWEEADYNRQVMINEITEKMNAGEWGVGSDNILRGPAGFEADLNNCPADWSNTSGLLDDEIRVGQTTVSSGNLAAYGNISWGWENYWNWINDELGGIGGRELKMIIKDDGYVAAQTIEFVDELIESENIFALHGLGSPNGLAVYDKINSECVPHLFYASGHPAWGDPVNHPWTTSHQMSYLTEAVCGALGLRATLPISCQSRLLVW